MKKKTNTRPSTKKMPNRKKMGNLYLNVLKNTIQNPLRAFKNWGVYFTTKRQIVVVCAAFLFGIILAVFLPINASSQLETEKTVKKEAYWFDLHRKSQVELLYFGIPGDRTESKLIKAFQVKTGMEGRPTPLPQLYGRDYWVITKKYETTDIPETAPYFIELDVPHTEEYPFGPSPYLECGLNKDEQCNWELSGPFGLHGINGDLTRLDSTNPGSSGCIRHRDEDITYLYNLLDGEEEVRYYIQDV